MSIAISGSSITFPDQTQQSTATGGSFRNRIINGDMRIDQRNAGASVTPTTDGSYNLDRWAVRLSQVSKFSVQRNAGAVTPPSGFTNYLGVTSLSSYSVTASDYFALVQYIEGFNISDLAFGSAGAKTVSISFWVRSSLTGTFGGSLENTNVNRSYPFSYAISASNTWERKTITIVGDTTGTWGSDNSIGFRLHIGLGVGSDSNRSNTAGAWVGAESFSATGATSVVGTNGATFYITGVQLEQGSTATDFERRPIGTELALCQRYYDKSYSVNVAPGTATANGMLNAISEDWVSTWISGGGSIRFTTEMRISPNFSYYDSAGTINRFSSFWNGGVGGNINPSVTLYTSTKTVGILEGIGGPAGGRSGSPLVCHYTADAEL